MSLSHEEIKSRKKVRFRAWYKARRAEGVDPITVRARRRKDFVLALVGTRCQLCGYDKCRENLAFHHVTGKDRGLSIKAFQCRPASLVEEIRKCVVVCHNCHGEVHNGLVSPEIVESEHVRLSEAFRAVESEFVTL